MTDVSRFKDMDSFEVQKYKVAVKVSNKDLVKAGVSLDDILERNPKAWEYLHSLREFAKKTTDYEWPNCGYTMEINVLPNEGVIITFAETIEDFVKGLKNSQKIADHGSILLRELIAKIEGSNEENARQIIKEFEKNMRETLSKSS